MEENHNLKYAIRGINRGILWVSRFDKDVSGDGLGSNHTKADIKNAFNEIERQWQRIDDFALEITPYVRLHPFNNVYNSKNPDALMYKQFRRDFFKFSKLSKARYEWLLDIAKRCKIKVDNITNHPAEISELNRALGDC